MTEGKNKNPKHSRASESAQKIGVDFPEMGSRKRVNEERGTQRASESMENHAIQCSIWWYI